MVIFSKVTNFKPYVVVDFNPNANYFFIPRVIHQAKIIDKLSSKLKQARGKHHFYTFYTNLLGASGHFQINFNLVKLAHPYNFSFLVKLAHPYNFSFYGISRLIKVEESVTLILAGLRACYFNHCGKL